MCEKSEGTVSGMRKRNREKEKRELISALAMVSQIGLAMMTCMAMSFGIGFYLDRLLGTKYWIMIFLLIGIMASIRSMFILTKRFQSTESSPGTGGGANDSQKGEPDAGSKENTR